MRFSELDGARIGVWGAGREIRSFAAQLARRLPSARIAVVALDTQPDSDPRESLAAPDAQVVVGEEVVAALSACAAVVRSPGVSIHRPELRALRAGGVPVATATGLWLAERGGRNVIGVTGTKGKSTTSALAAHLARAAGLPVRLAGNIGVPALDLLDEPADELAVIELSSYQIADLEIGPQVAVVLNLFPEHVDWHGSEEVYRAEKLRLLGLPGVEVAVVNGRDRAIVAAVPDGLAVRRFGVRDGWDVAAGGIARGGALVAPAAALPLRGEHNALNLCAALTALEAFGVEPPELPAALEGFAALPHRLEVVGEHDGATWVDDSISTTPESTLAALDSFPARDVVLIGGGQDRGQDYAALARALAARGAAVIGLPTTGGRLVAAARAAGVSAERAVEVDGMEAAVPMARTLAAAGPGSVVLLSPAAPSYDTYRNFEERGKHFRALATGRS
ncbi:MAG: UDP-N-acetylmuramoyl-L-alanine--D-glutamate ligase [Conexibacter sp.]